MLGDLLTAGLSGLLFSIPPLMIGYMIFTVIAEYAVRMVTDGDHKNTFVEETGYDRYEFRFFGKKIFETDLIIIAIGGLVGLVMSTLLFGLSHDYMTNHPGTMYLVNPFTEVLSSVLAVAVVVYINLLFAKYTYKVTKKVGQLKDSLKKHMADKEAHQ